MTTKQPEHAPYRCIHPRCSASCSMCNEAVADDSPAQCQECYGKGWNDEWKANGHYSGGEVFRIDCSACEGSGVKA